MLRHRRLASLGVLVLALLHGGPAATQSPSPDAMATARELVSATHAADQFKAIVPLLMGQLKPAIVQGRPEVERDYDAMLPTMLEIFSARSGEVMEAVAAIYARHFTVDEMQGVIAFYRTPLGEKLIKETPAISQESLAAGNKFGQSVAVELRTRIIEELRKRGHKI